jgi:8-oxo-dGTP pyrophosphatase MutT (NUDIX family)
MSDPKNKPAVPVPAATILLLRPGPDGLEVFMVVRHHQIDFASGALVFPGGKADEQDFDDTLLSFTHGASNDHDFRGAEISAIREAFEECGVLLARPEGSDDIIDGERLASLQQYREPLNNGELPLLEFLENERLVLACDQLTRFAHWITPPMMPKRFDTHFYLALAPADQVALHDGYESVDSVWIRPSDAVRDALDGKRTVIFPTRMNLEKLGHDRTPEDAIATARTSKIVPVLPWTEQRDDGNYICIPAEAGYDVNEEKMPERPA